MAEIVLGLGTSHGPMLHTPPEQWNQRVIADRRNKELCYKGTLYDFEQLVTLRRPGFAAQMEIEHQRRQVARCRAAISTLAERYAAAQIDLAVIVGNDQRELFLDDITPAITVYHGERIDNIPASAEQKQKMAPGVALAEAGHCPPEPAAYPGAPAFGEHLIRALMAESFDVASSRRLPAGAEWRNGIPHAYGFVYRQIMRDAPPPSVPIILNAFFPPNQPPMRRCLALGHALARAIAAWPGRERVALIGSGGLSHFVVDEELDAAILGAMRSGDEAALATMPDALFQSGSGEIRNWIPVAAAMKDCRRAMRVVDYAPFYRSDAGTGSGMAFAVWE
ncbi:MAG: protocatechuate 3,4-dioxygenase [Alphaproteobacteria bacterium]|nr:protocatechuate 3,4-dioxygenase [Alphaproteobacteria bacterium]